MHEIHAAGTQGDFTVTYIQIDPHAAQLRLVVPKDADSGGSTLWDYLRDERASAVFTGGYLGSFSPATPIGLVRYKSKTINNLKPSDPVLTGLLCFGRQNDDSAILIVGLPQASSVEEWNSCLQAGPLIIVDGKIQDELESLDERLKPRVTEASEQRKTGFTEGSIERALVLKNERGQIVLAVSSPASLFALRSLVTLKTAEGGFGAVSAIFLTGWQTAGLIVDGKPPLMAGAASTLLPNAIALDLR
ncbi:MAG: hypothetical protein QOJ84_1088 [Bradyrhizobium sp.]|nr:hypothetical protein [Bradyrhizobium sp.]